MKDLELLREYVHSGSQEAFAQIVRIHVDVVYSAARRQVKGDVHLAEDVTQKVFILLAQKAATLTDEVLLGGWLFNAVRFVARDMVRGEQRRANYEQKAAQMAAHLNDYSGKPDADWESAEAVLDEAMADLGEQTRGLLVLKFFEGKTAREVGQRLGISEEAARKRVSRAVDELRTIFARRGVVMSASALAHSLATQATLKAPADLAASATSVAMSSSSSTAATAGATSVSTTLKAGTAIMAISGTKLATAAVIGVVAIGGIFGGTKAVRYFSSPSGARTINLADAKPKAGGPTVTGTVLGPDGKPLTNAEVRINKSGNQVYAYPGRSQPDAMTDANGKYVVVRPADGPFAIVVRSPAGYAEISSQKLAAGGNIQLQPWGSIEGIAKAGDQPLPKTKIHLWRVGENGELVHHETEVTTDATGHFKFPQVAPGGVNIYRYLPGRTYRSADWQYIEVEPGKTAQANIGGNGYSVVGRIDIPPDQAKLVGFDEKKHFSYEAEVRREMPGDRPKHAKNESPEEYRAIEEAFGRTENGKLHKTWMFGSNFVINSDGTFKIDNLPPGKYTLTVRSFELQEEVNFLEDVAKVEGNFEIPAPTTAPASASLAAAPTGTYSPAMLSIQPSPSSQSSSLSPRIDIGTLVPTVVKRLRPGDPAPQFTITTLDGKTFNSDDHKNQLIAVIFWGTWSNTERLKPFGDFFRKWAKDPRIAIIGCFMTDDDALAKKYIADNKLDFPQAKDDGLMHNLDSSWPEAVLIGTDGKIIQKHLQGDTLEKFIRRALGLESPAATKKTRAAR